MTPPRLLRVLLADDSALVRVALRRALGSDAGLSVVGEAGTAAEALAQAERLGPDVVVLGLELPGGGALQVLECAPERPWGVLALAAGPVRGPLARTLLAEAIEVLEKPSSWDGPGATRLQERVRAAARGRAHSGDLPHRTCPAKDAGSRSRREEGAWFVPRDRRATKRSAQQTSPAGIGAAGPRCQSGPRSAPARDRAPAGPRLLAVGASTGGPTEVARLLAALPPRAHPPVVVVQHTDAGGIAPLAEWLTTETGRQVRVARQGETPGAGDVRLAPAGRHLVVSHQGRLELVDALPPSLHVPSIDALFLSLAEHLGPRGGGVVLSGMGDDGSRGLRALKDAGGATWVQHPSTAAAPGMPEAALATRAVDRALPMAQLVTAVREWMVA